MNRNFSLKFFLSILVSFFFLTKGASIAFGAASLSLSPATGGAEVGKTFNADVKLDTGGAATTGVDAVITFNAAFLQVTSVAWGSIFGTQSTNPTIDNAGGKIVLHPGVNSTAYAYTSPAGSPGIMATITFTGKASGTSTTTFTCTQGITQNDSNVWSNGSDIISCTSNTGASYTITTAGTTSEPTSSATPTTTPTPSQLLESGATEWTFLFLGLGIFFTLGGVRLLLAKKV